MIKTKTKMENCKNIDSIKSKEKTSDISYRLKCTKTANGLSHFVMYGDVPKKGSSVGIFLSSPAL